MEFVRNGRGPGSQDRWRGCCGMLGFQRTCACEWLLTCITDLLASVMLPASPDAL